MYELALELDGFNKRHYNEPPTEKTVVEELEDVTDIDVLLKYGQEEDPGWKTRNGKIDAKNDS